MLESKSSTVFMHHIINFPNTESFITLTLSLRSTKDLILWALSEGYTQEYVTCIVNMLCVPVFPANHMALKRTMMI